MASSALHLFPCRFSSPLRRNLTPCSSFNPSRRTRRLAFSTSHTMSGITGENQRQPLDEERVSVKHFIEQAKDLVKSDVGSPHWFSPLDCGHPLHDSPLLLFLPGLDGTGLGLIMHHQKLGKIFEVLCLHIPPKDRTPFTGVMMADLEKGVGSLSWDFFAPSVSYLSVFADILPIETLLWKLQMINSASSYANSRLHAVETQTLILSSGKDLLLPSKEEGPRLQQLLADCEIRAFEESGHFLFLEDTFDLVTVIKQVGVYRRSKERHFVLDYIPPSPSELKSFQERYSWINIMSSVIVSTLADGKSVRGFAGIPTEGPVLYVGNHMLMGFDIVPLMTQFSENDIILKGIAHPLMLLKQGNLGDFEKPFSDDMRLMGAVPVSGKYFFKLLSTKSHILLYPGGVREALHRKGEAYKLFWPERSEFVRMAARFGAKIVPFGAVGEDDCGEVLFDYEDQMKVPFLKNFIDEISDEAGKLRATIDGEVGNQALYFPGILPKFPGRFYYRFGKPIETEGRKEELRDRDKAHELYLQVKSEVENCITYLQEKRESDPYRSLASRLLFHARHGFTSQVPTFDID